MPELDAGTDEMFGQTPRGGSKRGLRGRGVLERVRWILMSYVTSPKFLVIAGSGLLLIAVGWVLPVRYYRYEVVNNDPHAPAAVFIRRDPSLILCLLPSMVFLAIGIGIPLASQFQNPLTRLAPGFAMSHGMVGVALALAVVLLCAVQLIIGGAEAIPALVVPACLVAAGIAYTAFTLLAGSVGLQGNALWLIYPHVAVMAIVGYVVAGLYPDQIFRGEAPGILAALAAVTVAECGLATWAFSRLVDWSSASSMSERAAWRGENPLAQSFGLGRMFRFTRPERRLEALLSATTEWDWWIRIKRWRLGNPPMPRLGFSFAFILLIGEVALTLGWNAIPFRMSVPFIVYFLFNWFLIDTYQISTRWRTRMPILSLEQMRPYSRRRLLSELIAGLVIDLAPVCAMFAAMLAGVLNLDATLRVDWARVPGHFVLWLLVGFVTQIEAAAVQIVIERLWLAWTATILSLVVNLAVVIALLVRIPNFEPLTMTLAMVESQLWAPALIAVIVSAVMARRFFQMEIGRRI